MKNVTSNLSNLKIKEDKLDVDKLKPFLVDLSKLSDVVKNVVKKDINALLLIMLKYMRLKTSIITNLATTNLATTTLNAKINEVKNKIPNITNVATTAALM